MAFKLKLLTTAAIPLIALAWMEPASATTLMRADVPITVQKQVITVQATEEELLKQQRKERRERRQKLKQEQNAGQSESQDDQQQKKRRNNVDAEAQQLQDNGEPVKPRRKKNADAENQQIQDLQLQDNGEPVKPRRKKNADAENQQIQDLQLQDNGEPVKPRRKKNADAENQQIQDLQLQDNGEPVKPRRKKNADAENQQIQDLQLQDNGEPVKPRRKKNADAENQQIQDLQLQDNGEPVKPRRKKNADAENQQIQDDNGSVEKIQTLKRKKNADAAEKPERVKRRKEIAADPNKTTDTIELPVENGAAVLDSDKDADKRGGDRERRKRAREEGKPVRLPKSDKDAQAGFQGDKDRLRIDPVLREKGERFTGFQGYDNDKGRRVSKDKNDFRVIINIDGRVVVRDDDRGRLGRRGETRYERLDNGRIREIVIRPNGDRIVTVRNRWGEIIRRSRIDTREREVVIFYSPLLERGRDRLYLRDAGFDLPPMRLRVPLRDYIVDVSSEPDRDYEEFLSQPPVEAVERVYSVDEVKYSARIRDKVRRIDLDTITFETGSAEIDMGQAGSLKRVGAAIRDILERDPGETFLIEGHTDAVGSDESNLVLSDERAESVANVLSDLFEIPAENLVTQGYGERFLKVDTDEPERTNRRVTIRRITSLVRPIAENEQ